MPAGILHSVPFYACSARYPRGNRVCIEEGAAMAESDTVRGDGRADLIFTGGRVHTVDATDTIAEDLTRVPAGQIRETGVLMTVAGGEIVHER